MFYTTADVALRKSQEKRLKEELDLVWMHMTTTEKLAEEMNRRYHNADMPFFIKIERIQRDNH